jgi:hypothetical protein
MPQRNSDKRRTYLRLVLFLLAGGALLAIARRHEPSRVHTTDEERARESEAPAFVRTNGHRRSAKRRVAASLAFTTLFFAGAAFTAGAGDQVAKLIDPNGEAVPAAEEIPATGEPCKPGETPEDSGCEEIPPAEEPAEQIPPPEEAPQGEELAPVVPEEAPAGEVPADEASAPVPGSDEVPAPDAEAGAEAPGPSDGSAPPAGEAPASSDAPSAPAGPAAAAEEQAAEDGPPVLKPYRPTPNWAPQVDPETELPGAMATVWLRRDLPDPTPPARRLTPAFAERLKRAARSERVDWALMLSVLRARGFRGSEPATAPALERLGERLRALGARRDAWQAVLGYGGRTALADRAIALRNYNRAVGLRALVTGFEAAKRSLERRVLNDDRIDIYAGGRSDIAAHRIDVRVLVLIRYLAEAHGQVTVSSLISGHRLFARPGVVSAHIYGLAADFSVLDNRPVSGNQEPGGLTEGAVRNILLLPVELRPQQVISLLGLGGPSFPLANHADHIHVGY